MQVHKQFEQKDARWERVRPAKRRLSKRRLEKSDDMEKKSDLRDTV
jgi:hypothetical protein